MSAATELPIGLQPPRILDDGEKRMRAELIVDGLTIGASAWQEFGGYRASIFYVRERRSSVQIDATPHELRAIGQMLIAQADRIDAEFTITEATA